MPSATAVIWGLIGLEPTADPHGVSLVIAGTERLLGNHGPVTRAFSIFCRLPLSRTHPELKTGQEVIVEGQFCKPRGDHCGVVNVQNLSLVAQASAPLTGATLLRHPSGLNSVFVDLNLAVAPRVVQLKPESPRLAWNAAGVLEPRDALMELVAYGSAADALKHCDRGDQISGHARISLERRINSRNQVIRYGRLELTAPDTSG